MVPLVFTIRPELHGSSVILRLAGELDLVEVPRLKKAVSTVLAAGPSTLTLDLGEVTFMDSSGIHTLLLVRKRAAEHGTSLVISGASPFVRRILEHVGLPPEVLAFQAKA